MHSAGARQQERIRAKGKARWGSETLSTLYSVGIACWERGSLALGMVHSRIREKLFARQSASASALVCSYTWMCRTPNPASKTFLQHLIVFFAELESLHGSLDYCEILQSAGECGRPNISRFRRSEREVLEQAPAPNHKRSAHQSDRIGQVCITAGFSPKSDMPTSSRRGAPAGNSSRLCTPPVRASAGSHPWLCFPRILHLPTPLP